MKPPTLPDAPAQYSQASFSTLVRELRRWFLAMASHQTVLMADAFIDIDRFPTQVNLVDLRSGQVYRDTTDNTLKVKP